MITNQQLNHLISTYVIDINKDTNNIVGNIEQLKVSRFEIEKTSNILFRFKIIQHGNHLVQIQCLSSFKILTILPNNTVFFEHFFKIKDTTQTLFHIVYDDIAICLFPRNNPNLILSYSDRLFLKSVNDKFDTEEQTIFPYEPIEYTSLIALTNQPIYFKDITMLKCSNIRDIFYSILTSYDTFKECVFISLGDPIFPIDFYIHAQQWAFIDRTVSFQTLKCSSRIINLQSTELHDISLIPDEKEWNYTSGVLFDTRQLPPPNETLLLWHKLIAVQYDNFYFSSTHSYIISGDRIRMKPLAYYHTIFTILDKYKDPKIHFMVQLALFSIFFIDV
jgi:hypothetical protein